MFRNVWVYFQPNRKPLRGLKLDEMGFIMPIWLPGDRSDGRYQDGRMQISWCIILIQMRDDGDQVKNT